MWNKNISELSGSPGEKTIEDYLALPEGVRAELIVGAPDFVVEIVSPGSAVTDMLVKPLYL